MNFDLPDDVKEAQRKARDFASRYLTSEKAAYYDEREEYPHEIRKKALEEKIVDFSNPWHMLVTIEELCRADPGLGISATTPFFGVEILMLFGNEQQKARYMERVMRGEAIMGVAVTEPGGGSDVAGIKTSAVKRGGNKWYISGSKMFITNGAIADFVAMLVRTSRPDEKRHHGLSVFLVDTKSKGFTANKLHGKLGVRATNTAELILNEVEVPEENLVGEEGRGGFYYIMTFFDISRIYVAAQAIGIARVPWTGYSGPLT